MAGLALIFPSLTTVATVTHTDSVAAADAEPASSAMSAVAHVPTPSPLKAIYMSQCVVGTPSFRSKLVDFIDATELNAVVIDIRDYTGKISFPTDNPVLHDSVSEACGANDMRAFIETLHAKKIYVIGRITVFQNPYYSSRYPDQAVQSKRGGVWKDHKGLAFVDVGARPYWDTVVELGKESYKIGFDELNFDYVRYPSDGPMEDAVYTWSKDRSKQEVLEDFFVYLTEQLRPTGAVLSVDLFGMTTSNEDDLNIGQVLERALPYFDHIYPMVYPSHYPNGFNGYAKVNEHAHDIVKYSMDRALERTVATTTTIPSLAYTPVASTSPRLYSKPSYPKEKIRPWLQSFDYPVPYTPAMVRGQIDATYESGLDSWIFWDAANKYTSLRAVLTATSTAR